ncbi:Acetyltransferase (GNAT) family protein [Enhydrobacter aerosaccus]|uniref:Acetyltransferase (GNAT) family protein n=1 Tax=Enhydrobacter aerosaccus TaxID=225324 RepID=A0A1T4TLZ6_9HYPH|nr:GNAT family N-acetyltransferase [Enhydrobacter aerosaccus]SKA41533.1 Acetyltransferase (GNAT) family protein [Enhydrobacter aerosaccus]
MQHDVPAGLSIRRASPADAEAVRMLTRAAYAKWVPRIGREPLPMKADYEQAVREHIVDLLFSGAEMAGLIETIDEGDHLLIENIAIAPAFQRRGLGRHLLAHAERLAVTLGRSELRLYTNPEFTGNVDLYRRHGYGVDREEAFLGGVTVYMSKRLAPA